MAEIRVLAGRGGCRKLISAPESVLDFRKSALRERSSKIRPRRRFTSSTSAPVLSSAGSAQGRKLIFDHLLAPNLKVRQKIGRTLRSAGTLRKDFTFERRAD